MADVSWTTLNGVANSNVYEVAFDATDKTTPVLGLNPRKSTTVAIKTTGAATVDLTVYLEDPSNSTPTSFILKSAAATAGGEDYIQEVQGPIVAIDAAGTITGGDTAIIQVLQSYKE